MQVAVCNSSSFDSVNITFLVEAVAYQAIEFAKAWGIDAVACEFYGSPANLARLDAADLWICEYVDKLDVDGALAYHSVDALGRPYLRCLPPSDKFDATDLSHEVLETMGDPTADRWVKMPDGTELAVEVCDPVQGDSYMVTTTVLGEDRQIKLSNYVLPAFFDPSMKGPWDRIGTLSAAFGMSRGGYEAVISPDGNEHDIYARLAGAAAQAAPKLHDTGSRLARRLRASRAA